jgi:hypothetical protein
LNLLFDQIDGYFDSYFTFSIFPDISLRSPDGKDLRMGHFRTRLPEYRPAQMLVSAASRHRDVEFGLHRDLFDTLSIHRIGHLATRATMSNPCQQHNHAA